MYTSLEWPPLLLSIGVREFFEWLDGPGTGPALAPKALKGRYTFKSGRDVERNGMAQNFQLSVVMGFVVHLREPVLRLSFTLKSRCFESRLFHLIFPEKSCFFTFFC